MGYAIVGETFARHCDRVTVEELRVVFVGHAVMGVEVALQRMEAQDGPALRARKARQDRIGGGSYEDLGDAASERLFDASGATCGYVERDQEGCCDDTPPKSPGRAHDLWRKVKKQYDLVEYHVLPEYLRDNEYILRHYRSDWPMKETLLSMFTIHNETLNIWT